MPFRTSSSFFHSDSAATETTRPVRAVRHRAFAAALRWLAAGALGLCTWLSPAGPTPAQAAIVERIVAVVGQRIILLSDLRERALPYLLRIYASVPEGPQRTASASQVYDFVLQTMVDEELEADAAQKAGVEITDSQVEAAIAQTAAQNQLTINQILVEAKRSGLSIKNYREELRRQLVQRTMMELRLRGRVNITDSDLRAAYRRLSIDERMQQTQRTLQLRIFAGDSEQAAQASRLQAEKIALQAQQGADFRQLIEMHATDSASGLRPPLAPAEEAKEVQRATLALEVGETSSPILVEGYWVILQVIERPPSQLPSYEEAREQVHERVYVEKITAARKHWLKGLRRRTHVEVRL